MDDLKIKAALAGLFFGIWPLIMQRSGLNGIASSIIFAGCAAVMLLPFSSGSWTSSADTKWILVFISGALGAYGLFNFNAMLAKATPQNLSTLFVLMILVQTAVPAIYQIIISAGSITFIKISGFVLAIVAAMLLAKN